MSRNDNSISFGMGLLAGVLGGILAGILLAPKPGEKTREELTEVVVGFAQKHSPEIKEVKKQALTSMDMMRFKLEKQYGRLNGSIKAKKLAKAKELENLDYENN